jgi:cytochrome c-type biogenesis protein CcmH/NrfF
MLRLLWLIPLLLLVAALLLLTSEYVAARPSRRVQDLAYVASTAPDFDAERHRLDVYSPGKKAC